MVLVRVATKGGFRPLCQDSRDGPYWSITRYHDIMVTIVELPEEYWTLSFIKMSSPKYSEQRNTISRSWPRESYQARGFDPPAGHEHSPCLAAQ